MRKAFLCLLILYSAGHLAYSVFTYNPIFSPVISGDFYASYLEAAHWRETGQFKLMASTNVPYPVFFYWWLFPLTTLSYSWVSAGLYVLQFPLYAWALALLVRAASPDNRIRPMEYGAALLMAVNFQPFLETLSQHKVEGLEFFLLCAAIPAFKEGKEIKSGVLIFLAVALKYLPGFLALYFFLKRKTRVVNGFLLAGAFCTAAFTLFFGTGTAWNLGVRQTLWLAMNRGADSNRLLANFEWQSLSQIVNRFFTRPDPAHPLVKILHFSQAAIVTSPRAAWGVALVLKLLFCFGFLWFIRQKGVRTTALGRKEWPLILLEISLTLLMMPILVQAFRLHYGILLLPAFVTTGLLILRQHEQVPLKEKVLFGAAFTLSGMLIPVGNSYARLYAWWSLPFYGYLLLGITLLLFHQRLRLREAAPRPSGQRLRGALFQK